MLINIINNIISIIFYSLVFFVSEYLCTNWFKLALKELDILEKLKQSI